MKNDIQLTKHGYSCQAEAIEASDNVPVDRTMTTTLSDIVERRMSRRSTLKGFGTAALGLSFGSLSWSRLSQAAEDPHPERFLFTEISHGVSENHSLTPGHKAQILIRWGDPIVAGAPAFDPKRQTATAQEKQFGYNNDYIGFIPLPLGSNNSDHGLLCVNHEYTNYEVMFPNSAPAPFASRTLSHERISVEMAASGCSIVEIKKQKDRWDLVATSLYNRRITATTPMQIAGPARGHKRMQTKEDKLGHLALGTLNNCAGGITPWGTFLTAEENFHKYFSGKIPAEHPESKNFHRYGLPSKGFRWGQYIDRFNLEKDPQEANRFGWIVEIDPFDASWQPRKRTALGRFSHEGAYSVVNKDGRLVLFSGDDRKFEYVYRFVSRDVVDLKSREANRDLLDHGILSVAKFDAKGSLEWLPLVFGQGPLTTKNGFQSQADVVIEARRAADLLGATPMDRPEDVEADPRNGKIYINLTNNSDRATDNIDSANSRPKNSFGQIIEMSVPSGDFAADRFQWEVLVLCGNPKDKAHGAKWHTDTSENGWFGSPDNCTVDPLNRLWIATDQGENWPLSGTADGLWGLETQGPRRGRGKMFFRVPVGAELCGPLFTLDSKNLFLAVQHPATDGVKKYKKFGRKSTFEDPATRWPDFNEDMPPRPSVVVITGENNQVIGT